MLNNPDIEDQFAYPYPLGPDVKAPGVERGPGRIRYEPFFVKMYGDCRKGEVAKRLKPVAWMPARKGGTVTVTTVNGVNERLAAVVKDLETLPASLTKYLVPSAGTYNCRPIANTNRLSVHAFGAALDINTQFSDYWEWSKGPAGDAEMAEPHPGRDRRDLRAPRLHLGRQVVSLRHHALRVSAGAHRARQARLAD